MTTNKKEKFLIKSGRSIETINFCNKINVNQKDIVWLVNRIEKEYNKISLNSDDRPTAIFKNNIEKVVRYLDLSSVSHKNFIKKRGLQNAIKEANKNLEDQLSVQSRILHKFNDGYFIINLTHKELGFESIKMNNCLADYRKVVENKSVCILALKNKNSKTICHLEIDKNGCITQAFEKGNKELKCETFNYIQDFFKIYEDKNIYKKIKKLGLSTLYSVNLNRTNSNIPIVESFFPTKLSKSILDEDEISIDLDSCKKIRNYVNSKVCSEYLDKGSVKDVVKKLEEYKKYIENNINNMILSIEKSHDNFFILNDEIIEKIYQKKPKSITLKLKEIIERKSIINDDYPMVEVERPYRFEEELPCCEEECEEECKEDMDMDVADISEWVDLKN